MTDLDNIQSQWQSLRNNDADRMASHNQHLVQELHTLRSTTLTQRLRRRYTVLGVLGLMFPVLAIGIQALLSAATIAVYDVFGICMGLCCLLMAYRLSDKFVINTTVTDAVRNIRALILLNRRTRLAGWIGAVAVLILLGYDFYLANIPGLLYGMAIGVPLGLAIGVPVEVRTQRELNQLLKLYTAALS